MDDDITRGRAEVRPAILSSLLYLLQQRDRLVALIRLFLRNNGFFEVTTPVKVKQPALEEHIDAFKIMGDNNGYLRTSPELHMKRLLVSGADRIFQIGPCFRLGEYGALHNPEYTMLEWYQVNANYLTILEQTKAMLLFIAERFFGELSFIFNKVTIDLSADKWLVYTISELFRKYAGWDPTVNFNADRFDIDLTEKVEPNLPLNVPVVLKDYPAQKAALSVINKNNPNIAERWELYLGGIEIANAYTELNNFAEQKERFKQTAEIRKKLGKEIYDLDEEFLNSLKVGMPNAGGIALGIDRLIMIFLDQRSIDRVIAFRE